MKRMPRQSWVAAAFLAFSAFAAAPAEAADLTIGLTVSPTSMDPHFHYVGQNMGPLSHVFDALLAQQPDLGIAPALATSWKPLDDTTWEFNLRKGVKFQDGSDFTADDVIFTLKRVPLVPNSPSSLAIYTKGIASITAPDPYRILIKTSTPDPEFAIGLSQIFILSHTAASGPAPEGKTTQQLNAGDGLVGTGPYRFVSFVPNDRMVVMRNPGYWGKPQPWITVTMRVIGSDASRAAAMLAGDLDATELPGESLASIKANPKLQITIGDTAQITYLALDQHEPSPGVSDTGGRNPLRDARVRKALSLAINRQAIAERVMFGLAEPAAELGPTTMFGVNPDAKADPYDPDQAKKLLTEAGYPNGFGLKFNSPNGVFPSDLQLAQAIAAMWTRVGVRTTLEGVPGSVFYSRRNKLEYSSYATNMSVFNGQLSYSLRILSMTRDMDKGNGQINLSGYSNPAVDSLLTQALRTINDDDRRKLVQQVSGIVMGEHQVLPIIRLRNAYVTRHGITIVPRLDLFLTAMQITATP